MDDDLDAFMGRDVKAIKAVSAMACACCPHHQHEGMPALAHIECLS